MHLEMHNFGAIYCNEEVPALAKFKPPSCLIMQDSNSKLRSPIQRVTRPRAQPSKEKIANPAAKNSMDNMSDDETDAEDPKKRKTSCVVEPSFDRIVTLFSANNLLCFRTLV